MIVKGEDEDNQKTLEEVYFVVKIRHSFSYFFNPHKLNKLLKHKQSYSFLNFFDFTLKTKKVEHAFYITEEITEKESEKYSQIWIGDLSD